MGISLDIIAKALEDFRGLKHRLQLVCKYKNVDYYNDSKATNVDAAVSAIDVMKNKKPIILIAGGIAKKEDYLPLVDITTKNCLAIILIGKDAFMIGKLFNNFNVLYADSMLQAVSIANKNISK